jgi:sigma-B regulation protein RsbU (phosphoserine phosphatase)
VRRAGSAAVLEDLNEVVHSEATEGMFVTLLYGVLDPSTGRIELANAGHLRPVIRRADGRCGELSISTGAALGFTRPLKASAYAVQLAPGELVALFSDGLSEASNAAGQRYESVRVIEAVKPETQPDAALSAILKSVRAFIGDRPLDDDFTLLCLGRSA